MKERQKIYIEEVSAKDFERYDLVTHLGDHYNFIGIGVMRNDMSSRAKKMVRGHIKHHLLHDWQNPQQNKTIHRINEAKALFFPGLRNPIGFAEAVIFQRKLVRLNKQKAAKQI
jgi:hypothetical protein